MIFRIGPVEVNPLAFVFWILLGMFIGSLLR